MKTLVFQVLTTLLLNKVHVLCLHFSNTGCRTCGSSLLRSLFACGRDLQPSHTRAFTAGKCEYYYFWYNMLCVRKAISQSKTIMKMTWNKSRILPSEPLPIYDSSSHLVLTECSVEKKIGPVFCKIPRLKCKECTLTK